MTGRPRRSGYTLVEMVVVIGAVTLVLGLCTTVLSALFRVDRAGREAVADTTTLARLARQFRQDARSAASVKRPAAADAGSAIEFPGADGEAVVYRVEDGRTVREDRRRGVVRGRESYATARLGPVTFGDEGRRVWVACRRRGAKAGAVPRPQIRIEATVGKDRGRATAQGEGS